MTHLERVPSLCLHRPVGTNCRKCGVYLHPQNQVLKTTMFDGECNCQSNKYLAHLRKARSPILDAKEISETTWALLQAVCEKFEFSTETLALGLYLHGKTNAKQENDQKFWACTSLLVASKAIELDRKVPYLNRFQKYADKSMTQEDYETAEKKILEQMNFNLQTTTFVSFINLYMSNGFLFEKDGIDLPSIKLIEDDLLARVKDMLRNGSFLGYDPEKLALSLIKEVRIKHRIEPWNAELEIMTQTKSEDIHTLEKNNILKPVCMLSIRAKEKLSHMSHHNSIVASLQNSSQLVENKPKLIRKRNDSSLKANTKENMMKPGHSSSITAVVRSKQTLSVSKCPLVTLPNSQNNPQGNSFDRLAPLNFQNRRI